MTTKQRLHEIIEQLSDDQLNGVERFLTDPTLAWMFTAPDGEPPLSMDEIVGILIAKQEVAEGKARTFSNIDELLADLHSDEDDEE